MLPPLKSTLAATLLEQQLSRARPDRSKSKEHVRSLCFFSLESWAVDLFPPSKESRARGAAVARRFTGFFISCVSCAISNLDWARVNLLIICCSLSVCSSSYQWRDIENEQNIGLVHEMIEEQNQQEATGKSERYAAKHQNENTKEIQRHPK